VFEPQGPKDMARIDALRLGVGLPQRYDSYEISPHTPSQSENNSAVYYRFRDPSLRYEVLKGRTAREPYTKHEGYAAHNEVLGNYTLYDTKDYTSVYDKWDLAPFTGWGDD